jgi:hypothetical protein
MNKNRREKQTKKKSHKLHDKNKVDPSEVVQRFREQGRHIYEEAMTAGKIGAVLEEARKLASEATESDASIDGIYWFPHDEEVHLVMVDKNLVPSGEESVEPFYFDSTSTDPFPSGIAIIGPDEYRRLKLPRGWGDWDDGKKIAPERGGAS